MILIQIILNGPGSLFPFWWIRIQYYYSIVFFFKWNFNKDFSLLLLYSVFCPVKTKIYLTFLRDFKLLECIFFALFLFHVLIYFYYIHTVFHLSAMPPLWIPCESIVSRVEQFITFCLFWNWTHTVAVDLVQFRGAHNKVLIF